MEWEFKRNAKVKEYSSKRFQQLLQKSSPYLYQIQPCLCLPELLDTPTSINQQHLIWIQQLKKSLSYPYLFNKTEPDTNQDDDEPEETPSSLHSYLTSLPKWIRDKYADVFDAHQARILPAHKQTDHAIDVISDSALPF
jgi:hypothetical protein